MNSTLMLFGGCGALPDDFYPETSAPPGAQARDCLNCGETGGGDELAAPEVVPSALVAAAPASLMFFAEATDREQLGLKQVVVSNGTLASVEVVEVGLELHPEANCSMGPEFFRVYDFDLGRRLSPGAEMVLDVEFLGSFDYQQALLVVRTTHQEYARLSVSLSGQLFLGDLDW